MVRLKTARQVIKAFGGSKRFADALGDGTTPQAVNNWAKAKFPANRYVIINQLVDITDIRISDSLFAMRQRRRAKRR
jgi:hypothetical protein